MIIRFLKCHKIYFLEIFHVTLMTYFIHVKNKRKKIVYYKGLYNNHINHINILTAKENV